MTQHKVWIHIEAFDEEQDHYRDINEPQEAGCFSSEHQACHCAEELLNRAGDMAEGLYKEPPPQGDIPLPRRLCH